MRLKSLAAGACVAAAGASWAEEAADEAAVEPDKIDVVYERLGVQKRTLETVVEIVTQLEAVAGQSGAAQELLSEEGDPTERLKRALDQVVRDRLGRVGDAPMGTPVVVEAPAAEASRDGEADEEETARDVAVEVVYAQRGDDGRGRVVVAVGGSHYAATVGQRVRVGEDVVEIVTIRDENGGGLSV